MNVKEECQAVKEQVVAWYQHLHQHPEPSFEEFETTQFIEDILRTLPGFTIKKVTPTGLIADLQGAQPGKTIALRADIDCLRMEELSDVEFRSKKEGLMHACGHDSHTAMLLGVAKILSDHREELTGTYRLLFQPAEELPPGGAIEFVKAGVLEDVDYVLGQHVMPFIPTGQFGLISGPAMAASDSFFITLKGSGGHASQPHATVDPIAVGIQLVASLQQIVAREVDPLDNAVVSVTQFHSGSAINVIPEDAYITGSVRTFKEETRQFVAERIKKITSAICEAHRATAEIKYEFGYDATANDPAITEVVRQVITEQYGDTALPPIEPLMGAEDFSRYLRVVPGCYYMVGIGNEAKGLVAPTHHGCFRVDTDALPLGMSVMLESAFCLAKA